MPRRAPRTGTPRTSVLGVRVPPEQREAIEAAAAAAGMTASAFVADAMAKFVASNGDLSDSVATLRASASSAAIAAVNIAPAPANDVIVAVNKPSSGDADVNTRQSAASASPTGPSSAVNKDANTAQCTERAVNNASKDVSAVQATSTNVSPSSTPADHAERQASNDELVRELAALFEKPSGRPVNTDVNKASVTTSTPASAVNNAPPVKISASIPVYGQVPGFTYIGTQAGISTPSVTDQRVRVPTWQTPSDRPRGGLRLQSKAPTPPSDPNRRARLDLSRFFERDADAPKRNEPLVNPADPSVLYELKRIGNNINQIAHAVNGSLPPDVKFTVQSFRHLFEALTDDVEFRRRLDAIRMRSEFNGTAHPQSRRGLP